MTVQWQVTVNTQVRIVGNMLVAADGTTKQAIVFHNTAASGKWNGVVENNFASVTEKPNNI